MAETAPAMPLHPQPHASPIARRPPDERRVIARIKRLSERFRGDSEFRRALLADAEGADDLAARYGIEIHLREVLPLFWPDRFDADPETWGDRWPAAKLWADYISDHASETARFLGLGECRDANPAFDAWRKRQIRRCTSELGPAGAVIAHPILAFELSAGCSIGCWFCGVSAERFRGNFLYTEANARLWRDMLAVAVSLFGPAARSGFCYWATDPCDNPDYADFVEDFLRATGTLPQTTTAAPLKNIALTRRILALQDAFGSVSDRFSILNRKTLDRVHETFTADELLNVELVLQNPESELPRTFAGRARERTPAAHAETEAQRRLPDATIACVSGFLVNMVERTVRLITPVSASERWPLGYRTYGIRRFTTAEAFGTVVRDLVACHMPSTPPPGDRLRFRDDLVYRAAADGFELDSRGSRFAYAGSCSKRLLGDLVASGEHTAGAVQSALVEAGSDVFVAANLIRQLFDRGLFQETVEASATETQVRPALHPA